MPQKAPSKLVSKPNRWGYPVGPSNEVEEELRDLYIKKLQEKNNPYPDNYSLSLPEEFIIGSESRLPKVESPGMFKQPIRTPAPLKTGDVEEPPWDYLQRVVPELRGTSPSIQMGPTASVLEDMARSGFNEPKDYERTNLLGARTHDVVGYGTPGEISINPELSPKGSVLDRNKISPLSRPPHYLDRVTAHEIGHGAGFGHDRDIKNIEGLMMMGREAQRMKEGRPSISKPRFSGFSEKVEAAIKKAMEYNRKHGYKTK